MYKRYPSDLISFRFFRHFNFVRVRGIEPRSQPWEGRILPLNHARFLASARSENRTHTTLRSPDFKSGLSTNFSIRAGGVEGNRTPAITVLQTAALPLRHYANMIHIIIIEKSLLF